MAMSQCYRTSEMTADEVIARFKDKMAQLSPALRKAFLTYDKKNRGRITKAQFREVGTVNPSKDNLVTQFENIRPNIIEQTLPKANRICIS